PREQQPSQGPEEEPEEKKLDIEEFAYDLTRAVAGDHADITMLLKPGTDAHAFEPTPKDIININNSDLFIYIGGESDGWVSNLLKDNEIDKNKVLRLMDEVTLKEEEIIEGMETTSSELDSDHSTTDSDHSTTESDHADHEDNHNEAHDHETTEIEYDEHIWTSIPNSIKLLDSISKKLSTIAPEYASDFAANTRSYTDQLSSIDQSIRTLVVSAKNKHLVFADRFPFRYFVDEYDLTYSSAFPGCSEQTEASSSTISYLIDKVKQNHLPVIFKIELTSDQLAQTISNETGAKILEFSSAHNVSESDFNSGITYLDILNKNLDALRQALN
ncbi:zinc ABC transporter substrate-binding protein, partial [Candidatus Saccharibacteria bacterium]|nr:zinc ABC transporter substrate-binding protein [Candidatus Saccharibacteria bacterium]